MIFSCSVLLRLRDDGGEDCGKVLLFFLLKSTEKGSYLKMGLNM